MRDYQQAIQLLNSLQTNSAILEAVRKSGNLLNTLSIPEMQNYIRRIGYNLSDLDRLNTIHIAGTKGKGSTVAFCQSILKTLGLQTGMFTSPHILQVRERFRINGVPISQPKFAKYFFDVWDRLEATKPTAPDLHHPDKPAYFRYLTLMCFHVFMQEKIDVLLLEGFCVLILVGVGGQYDSTNVVANPIVCGITPLGMDHMSLLGDSIDKIAWHKAGIIKSGVPVVTAPQPETAMTVIEQRARELSSSNLIKISSADIEKLKHVRLGLAGEHQYTNAACAVALVNEWTKANGVHCQESFIEQGLRDAKWPGRCQTFHSEKYPLARFFLDGAHTPESLQVCAEWFNEVSSKFEGTSCLVFNCTHGRQASLLLPPLIDNFEGTMFEHVIFTTNDPWSDNRAGDLSNLNDDKAAVNLVQKSLADYWREKCPSSTVYVVETVEQGMQVVSKVGVCQVLVTGSLHLVGSALTVLGSECE
jgi:folylpolyglutamate synthase